MELRPYGIARRIPIGETCRPHAATFFSFDPRKDKLKVLGDSPDGFDSISLLRQFGGLHFRRFLRNIRTGIPPSRMRFRLVGCHPDTLPVELTTGDSPAAARYHLPETIPGIPDITAVFPPSQDHRHGKRGVVTGRPLLHRNPNLPPDLLPGSGK
jgi:hypothetical protein